ncbi:unnamed protein product [Peniophora sp. CBMAI 1063]|nr:unnamed protein product [Peniophora sp. CBMAI 1063]
MWSCLCSRKIVTVTGIGALTIACVGGVYVLLSSYGAFALREFYGPAYYDLHLGDDAGAWQWQVWLALPLIPLSLVSARIPGLPLPSLPTALLLPWPSLFPTPALTAAGTSYALTPAARSSPISSTLLRRTSLWPLHPAPLWPPSPTLLCTVMPIIGGLYGRLVKRLEKVAIDIEGGQSGVGVGMPEPVRRFVWALGGGDAAAEVRIDIARAEAPAAGQAGGDAAAAEQAQAGAVPGEGAGEAQPQPQPGLGEEEGEAAARIVRVTGASLGRVLGGALALPTIARLAGALLLRLSHYSPILSRILAARPDASTVATVYEWDFGTTNSGGVIGAIQRAARKEGLKFGAGGALMVFGRMLAFGHRAWMDGDPVWWRNALGLGLFVVAKDALRLLHLRLAALELASRRLKDRDFAGIDPAELDLVRPWPVQGRGIGVARA